MTRSQMLALLRWRSPTAAAIVARKLRALGRPRLADALTTAYAGRMPVLVDGLDQWRALQPNGHAYCTDLDKMHAD